MRSNLVYRFSCASSCEASECGFVVSTFRTLGNRISDHMGVTYGTSSRLAHPPHSSIRRHYEECDVSVKRDHFKILAQCPSEIELRLLESLYIFKLESPINDTASSFSLQIVNSFCHFLLFYVFSFCNFIHDSVFFKLNKFYLSENFRIFRNVIINLRRLVLVLMFLVRLKKKSF